jgi:SAM-dependent methyltransferase
MKATKYLWPAFTAGILLNGLRLRQRIASIDVLEETDSPVAPHHRFVTAAGVTVDAATARAASLYATRHGFDIVDIVPADLSVERLLDLVRLVDPSTYVEDPLSLGRGAGHALLVSDDVAKRAQIDSFAGLDALEMVQLTAKIKNYASRRAGLALAPGFKALPDDPSMRIACLDAIFNFATPVVVAMQAAELGLLAGGAIRGRRGALAAAAAYSLQPLIAVAGTAASPRDLPHRSPLRIGASLWDIAQAVWRRQGDDGVEDDMELRRAEYEALIADGPDAFLEEPRPDCPFCGSDDLHERISSRDVMQHKPGIFRLDECRACGHIFQNPRLTVEGLDYYYRDFYDGVGEQQTEVVFSNSAQSYAGRAEMLQGVAEPRRWLDVGAGHGHFCLIAQSTWPKTTFDGLDMSDVMDEAERRGWISRGYIGMLPDLADELAGQYDVVSMHHYLEHTRDPAAEVDAAATVLEPGGLLLIELPDPSSWMSRVVGRWWGPWFQPQHQNFFSVDNLRKLLGDHGFTTVAVQRAEPHQPCDLAMALFLVVNRLAPPTNVPWRPPSTTWDRLKRGLVLLAAAPFLFGTFAFDQLAGPLLSRIGASNSYRLLARKDGSVDGASDGE